MRRLRCTSIARATSVSPAATAAWKVMCASMPDAIGPCEFDARPNAESASAKIAPPWQPPLKLRWRASIVIATSAWPGPPERKVMPSVLQRPSLATRPAMRSRQPSASRPVAAARRIARCGRCAAASAGAFVDARRPTPTASRCASSAADQLVEAGAGQRADDDDARRPVARRRRAGAASASRASRARSARRAAGRPC